jgi:hypothetical protein
MPLTKASSSFLGRKKKPYKKKSKKGTHPSKVQGK